MGEDAIPNGLSQSDISVYSELPPRPPVRFRDVVSNLSHFAIITYAVDPILVRQHVHERFEFDLIEGVDGRPKALVSMVPFEDLDFHFVGLPWLKFRFGQAHYRTYVTDRETGERAIWFFETILDSWTVAIPRHLWKLPWHRGQIRFDCKFDSAEQRYVQYRVKTESSWASDEIELEDSGQAVVQIDGFASLEAARKILTRPLLGLYYRRDGQLGTYHIWHDRLRFTAGRVKSARIGLFDRFGFVPFAEQSNPQSVLILPRTEFTIYLPPGRYTAKKPVSCPAPFPV